MPDKHSLARINSASNISKTKRQSEDFYATPPRMVDLLFKYYNVFNKSTTFWEPCNGMGHISAFIEKKAPNVLKSDIIDRTGDTEIFDFFKFDRLNKESIPEWLLKHCELYDTENGLELLVDADIVTNPPYNKGTEFYEKACSILAPGQRLAVFVKIQFLETQKRYDIFQKYPPKKVLVCINRVHCGKEGLFDNELCSGGAACYCWLIYEKGYKGRCTLDWINTEEEIKEYQYNQITKLF